MRSSPICRAAAAARCWSPRTRRPGAGWRRRSRSGSGPRTIGADYLVARTGRADERAAAEALSEALGGLPLAHEQAAAYCERLEKSLGDYRKRFEAAPARLLDDDARRAGRVSRPADGGEDLRARHRGGRQAASRRRAADRACRAAGAGADPAVPVRARARQARRAARGGARRRRARRGDSGAARLRAHRPRDHRGRARPRHPTDTIRLHRLVRQVAAARRVGDARALAQRALMEALAAVYPPDARDDPKAWPPARRLDGHALAMVGGDAVPPAGAEDAGERAARRARLLSALRARRLRAGATALRARARDQREGARSRASGYGA